MENESLEVSSVPRALDMKSKLFGFELPDLLLIFMNLAVTNLVFGGSSLRYFFVWGSTAFLAAFLFFAKRGRPDSYLQHFGEFLVKPTYLAAGMKDTKFRKFGKGTQE